MVKSQSERTPKARVVLLGGREVIAEGLHLNFWADISHRCMTASWPAFIGGAALVFVAFNAVFAFFYWIGNQPISNVPRGAYIDYLYFSIETLSTAGYGDMHPQVESRCSAVALGRTYLLPPLSSGGALVVQP
jgi:inward rectifier potassium channel